MANKRVIASRDYNGSLPDHTNIRFWECYAKHVLMYLDEAYSNLLQSEKPDLIDLNRSLGIEVVDAIDSKSRKADSLYSLWQDETDCKRKVKYEEEIERCGARLVGGCLAGPSGHDSFGIVLESFCNKLKKLNGGGYQHFDSYQLFIRSDIFIPDDHLSDLLKALKTRGSAYEAGYEKVILSVPCYNYCFDLASSKALMLPFPSEDQYEVAMKARQEVIEAECCLGH